MLCVQALQQWALPWESLVWTGGSWFYCILAIFLVVMYFASWYPACKNIRWGGLVGDFSALYFLAQILSLVTSKKKSGTPSQFPVGVLLHVLQTHLRGWVHRAKITQKQNKSGKKKHVQEFCSFKSSPHTVTAREMLCFGCHLTELCVGAALFEISSILLALWALKSTSQVAKERSWDVKLTLVSNIFLCVCGG